jgi:hypothetical protein
LSDDVTQFIRNLILERRTDGRASRRPKKQAGDACIGRSRGGLTTKLHLRVIGNGLPVQIELSPGQMNPENPVQNTPVIDPR